MKVMLILDAFEISEFPQNVQDEIRRIFFNQPGVAEQSHLVMPTIQPAPPVTPAAPATVPPPMPPLPHVYPTGGDILLKAPATVPPPMPPLPPHIVNGVRVFPAATNQLNQQSGGIDVTTGQPIQVPGGAPLPSHVAPPVIPSVMPVTAAVPMMPNIPPAVVAPMPALPGKSAAAVKMDAISVYTSGPEGPQRLGDAIRLWSQYMGTTMTMSGLSDANAPLLQKALSEVMV